MADQADAPPLSQLSADFPLEPVTGKTLFLQDRARRDRLHGLGGCRTGCAELDDEVLLGGFERGRVVGVSAEEDDVGVLVSFCFLFLPHVVSTRFLRQGGTGRQVANRGCYCSSGYRLSRTCSPPQSWVVVVMAWPQGGRGEGGRARWS